MKTVIQYLTFFFIAFTITFSSCKKSVRCIATPCTKDFKMIGVRVNPPLNMPPFTSISLKVYKPNGIFWKEVKDNNDLLFFILGDNDMSEIERCDEFKVEVIYNGTIAATEIYELGKDCCHIQKFKGKSEINL